ncbi:M14 family metallopeptidase [Gluconobacter kondonii]|uniref:succinylglutamate desuccinylase/aspartoacylase domain-containing protein n=1 Tax=Gluconobacter kondonii TaxID=941463 RepID=UPI0020127029|nr:succinylglutamate desuccinylase/aspartoacylase family protein [Gluconobacter kondonii]
MSYALWCRYGFAGLPDGGCPLSRQSATEGNDMSCKAGQRHHPVRIRQPRLSETLPGFGQPPPVFKVSLPPPDLAMWRLPPSGVPGIWIFDSGRSGPEIVITAMVHGNEYAGGWALENFRQRGVSLTSGRLTFIVANLEAFDRFDIRNPVMARHVDEDLNRLWHSTRLDGRDHSSELERARQLQPYIARADLLLDLHSTLWPSEPLFIASPRQRSAKLACALAAGRNLPQTVLTDLGHQGGARLIEHAHFMSPGGTGRSCLLEAGSHWEPATVTVMESAIERLLAQAEAIHLRGHATQEACEPEMAVVTDNIIARHSDFSFVRPWEGGVTIPKAGTLLAHDGHDLIYTPYDECLLIMPNLRPRRGQLAVRLARRTAAPFRS